LLLNVVNLGEVFYRLIQLTGATQAEERLAEIKARRSRSCRRGRGW